MAIFDGILRCTSVLQNPATVDGMHVTVYVGCSMDGFIARPDGAVDFLDPEQPPETDLGFSALLDRVDVLVMGRNTFDFVINSGFPWGYGDLPVRVATTRELTVPSDLEDTVAAISGTPAELVEQLTAQGFDSAYVDGGQLGAAFFRDELVDQVTLTFVPVMIGQGIRVFPELTTDQAWRHSDTTTDPCGFVQVSWVRA
jgi:dihydrofolate reductase